MPQAVAATFAFVSSVFGGTAFGTATVSATIASATAAVAANAALSVAVNSVVRNNSKEKPQGGLIDLQLNGSAPRQLVIGKRLVGGVLVDWYLAGDKNTHIHLPIYLGEGPCGQVTKVYAGGRLVLNTPLVHGVKTVIPDFRSGGDRLWVTYYDGRAGQNADAVLTGLGQGWTSANKMTGCAYIVVEAWWDSDNMLAPPSLTFEMEGAKLYDRRKDSTAGGSGSHRIDDPSTWEWSDNPAVALDHFMLGRFSGSIKTFGIGLSADEVPYDRFAAQANICDEDVALKAGGTQKRYRANGFIHASDDYASTISKLCTAMAARPADFGGRFGVVGVESRTPVLTIDDGDLIAGSPETYSPKRSWSELVTAIEGRFQDPAQLYQPVDYPRVTDGDWQDEDGSDPKIATLDLEFETNVERAQRIALLKARAERRQATLKGVYPLWTVELERGDWFIRTGAKWGDDGKTFEVVERILNPETFTVAIVAQEVDAADSAWDENVAQDGPPTPADSTSAISDIEIPSIDATAINIIGDASSIPAIKVEWDDPIDPRVRAIYIEVENTDGVTPKTSKTIVFPSDVGEAVFQDGIVDGGTFSVSAKFITDTLHSAWCTAIVLVGSATYTVPRSAAADLADAIADGVITTASFAAGITPVEIVATLPVTGNFLGRTVFLTSDNKLYRYGGSGFTAVTAAADITGQVSGSQIADAAITAAKAASGVAFVEIVATLPVSGNYEGRTVYLTTDDKWYRHNGTSFVSTTAAADITGQLISTQLQDAAVIAAKIADGAVTVDKLAAQAITAAKLALVDLENLVTDPLVTDTTSVWLLVTAGVTASSSSEITGHLNSPSGVAFSGTGMTNATNSECRINPNYYQRVEGGKTYRASFRRRVKAGFTGVLFASISWYDQAKSALSSTNVPLDADFRTVAAAADANAVLDAQATAPSGAAYVRFRFVVQWSSTLTNAGTIYVADPKLNRANSAELIVDGSIIANKIAAGAVTANAIAAQSITAAKLALVDLENLVPDPLFQEMGTVWNLPAGAAPSTSSEITSNLNSPSGAAFTGAGQAAGSNVALSVSAFYLQRAEPGKNYRLSLRWRLTAGFTGLARIEAQYFDQANAQIGATAVVAAAGDYRTVALASGTTVALDAQVTAPANTAKIRIVPRVYWSSTLTNAGMAYCADPKINRAASAELIVDGAVTAAKIAALAVTAGKIDAGAVTATELAAGSVIAGKIAAAAVSSTEIAARAIVASKLAITDIENLLTDPLITDTTNIWSMTFGAAASTSAEITANLNSPSGGVFPGAGQTSANNSNIGIQSNYYARVEGGKSYRFSIRTRRKAGFTGWFLAGCDWYDQSKTLISSALFGSLSDYRSVAAASDATQVIDGQIAAPSNAAYVKFNIGVLWSATLTNAGSLYVADPKLNRAMSGELIVDGAITAAKIDVISLDAISATIGLLRTATTGARMELEDNQQRIYDSSGTLRVRIGVW